VGKVAESRSWGDGFLVLAKIRVGNVAEESGSAHLRVGGGCLSLKGREKKKKNTIQKPIRERADSRQEHDLDGDTSNEVYSIGG